jgi:hypothetical protein
MISTELYPSQYPTRNATTEAEATIRIFLMGLI